MLKAKDGDFYTWTGFATTIWWSFWLFARRCTIPVGMAALLEIVGGAEHWGTQWGWDDLVIAKAHGGAVCGGCAHHQWASEEYLRIRWFSVRQRSGNSRQFKPKES